MDKKRSNAETAAATTSVVDTPTDITSVKSLSHLDAESNEETVNNEEQLSERITAPTAHELLGENKRLADTSEKGLIPQFVQKVNEMHQKQSEVVADGEQLSERVTDKKTIDFLENQEHIVTYKAMQLIDGKLYPPMAAKVKGADGRYHLTNPSELGIWQQAIEDTSNIQFNAKGIGYYVLNKGDGKSIKAAYNPYEHSSNLVLNDQFEGAYTRDNLVTVECVIPVSEMTSGYKAQYAKDSTGFLDWKSGVVAGKIKGNKRKVYLSRWLKPVRILSDAETAEKYKEALGDSGVSVPFNVVTPSLLSELEKIGVPIDYEGSPQYRSIQERKKDAEIYSYEKLSPSDYYTEGRIYTYDFLVAQKDMVCVELPKTGTLTTVDGKIDSGKVVSLGIKNALSVGTKRGDKIYVKNDYTNRELRIDNSTIRHGLDGTYNRLLTNARLCSVIGYVVKNAIPINALKNASEKAVGTYAMAAYCKDNLNREFIAIITVEQHSDNIESIELYDVAHAISGRQKKSSQVDTKSQGVYPIKATTISISQLLGIVNSTHQSILSDDVLEHFGAQRNPKGTYSDDVLFSERTTSPTAHELLGENKRLEKELQERRADAERLRKILELEKKVYDGIAYDVKRVGAVADYLLKEWDSKYDKLEMEKRLREIYDYIIANGGEFDLFELERMSTALAEDVLAKAKGRLKDLRITIRYFRKSVLRELLQMMRRRLRRSTIMTRGI